MSVEKLEESSGDVLEHFGKRKISHLIRSSSFSTSRLAGLSKISRRMNLSNLQY